MRIYGITVERVRGKDLPVLRNAEVKETKLYYRVNGHHSFLGYRSLIEKTRQEISFTAIDAWETYINRCARLRRSLWDQAAELTEFQVLAASSLERLLLDNTKRQSEHSCVLKRGNHP